jgi:hypothetical protein
MTELPRRIAALSTGAFGMGIMQALCFHSADNARTQEPDRRSYPVQHDCAASCNQGNEFRLNGPESGVFAAEVCIYRL